RRARPRWRARHPDAPGRGSRRRRAAADRGRQPAREGGASPCQGVYGGGAGSPGRRRSRGRARARGPVRRLPARVRAGGASTACRRPALWPRSIFPRWRTLRPMYYIEFIEKNEGISQKEFQETVRASNERWAAEHPNDELVMMIGRTWRLGPRPT